MSPAVSAALNRLKVFPALLKNLFLRFSSSLNVHWSERNVAGSQRSIESAQSFSCFTKKLISSFFELA
jgi:hypothetical protein